MKYEHKAYLSDGTVLSQSDMDAIRRDGSVQVGGRTFTKTDSDDYLWAQDTIAGFQEKTRL